MTANAIVWWATLVALVVILALTGAQVVRALREVKRIKARTAAFADLPVLKALERAEADGRRIASAAEHVTPLIGRAQAAAAIIRRGPVPPELVAAARGVAAEIAALRSFASR